MKIRELIQKENPYLGFNRDKYKNGAITSHVNSRYGEVLPSFNYALEYVKDPKLLVEVGTYLGASAIFFGKELEKRKLKCEILCIDTFVGSITHWTQPEYFKDLNLENGFPTLYKQFLAEVIDNNLQDTITPLPLTSLDGARLLKFFNIRPDLIYIDASHEYPDVYFDVNSYYEVLNDKGVIFGDDYDGWAGVKNSVNLFCEHFNVKLEVYNGKWFIKK